MVGHYFVLWSGHECIFLHFSAHLGPSPRAFYFFYQSKCNIIIFTIQGGYVLYKLFRKADERAPGQTEEAELPNLDEVDRSGFSPAPSRSSPGETQQDGEISDEITAPVGRKSVLQDSRLNLPNSVAGKKVGIQRWLEETDCKPAKQDENNSNSDIGLLPQKTVREVLFVFSFLFGRAVLCGCNVHVTNTMLHILEKV